MSENNKTETFEEAPSLEIDEAIIKEVKQEHAVQASSRHRRSGSAGFLAFLALLLAGGGIAAGYYLYDKEIKPLGKLSGKFSELRQFTASKQALGDVQQQLQEMKEGNQVLQSGLANAGGDYQSLEAGLNQLRQQASFGQRDWSLAEVDHLINIARDRLEYMRDSKTAAAAMRGALQRVDSIADPSLNPLRKQITDDLQVLEAYQPLDAGQVLQKLTAIAAGLQPLPERPQTRQPQQQSLKPLKEKGIQELWTSFKQALTGRVRIVKHDEPLNALSQQGVAGYKIDALNLRIEILRLALLRDDSAAFKRELNNLASWADASLPPNQAESIVNEVAALGQIEQMPLPQIQASVSGFSGQQKSPQAPAVQPPDFQQEPAVVPETLENPVHMELPTTKADPAWPDAIPLEQMESPTNVNSVDMVNEPTASETMKQESAPEELIKLQEMLEQIDAAEKQGGN